MKKYIGILLSFVILSTTIIPTDALIQNNSNEVGIFNDIIEGGVNTKNTPVEIDINTVKSWAKSDKNDINELSDELIKRFDMAPNINRLYNYNQKSSLDFSFYSRNNELTKLFVNTENLLLDEQTRIKIDKEIDKLIKSIPETYSIEAKLLYIQEQMKSNAPYAFDIAEKVRNEQNTETKERYVFTPEGVFLKHSAVCEGYSKSFMLIADKLNIEARYLTDRDALHAWNAVKIKDKWYIYDITRSNVRHANKDSYDTNLGFLKSFKEYKSIINSKSYHNLKDPITGKSTLDNGVRKYDFPLDINSFAEDKDGKTLRVGKYIFSDTNQIYMLENNNIKINDSESINLSYPYNIIITQFNERGNLEETTTENVAYQDLKKDLIITMDIDKGEVQIYDKDNPLKNKKPIYVKIKGLKNLPGLQYTGKNGQKLELALKTPTYKIVDVNRIEIKSKDKQRLNIKYKLYIAPFTEVNGKGIYDINKIISQEFTI